MKFIILKFDNVLDFMGEVPVKALPELNPHGPTERSEASYIINV